VFTTMLAHSLLTRAREARKTAASGGVFEMRRKLGTFELFAVATGAMISSGIFVLPGMAFSQVGPAVFVSYALAALLAFFGAVTVSELVSAMPKAGGDYFFITRGVGSFVGTVSGLLSWLALSSKSAFALVGIAEVTRALWAIPPAPVALGLCALFVVLNMIGVRESGRAQSILVIVLLVIAGAFVVIGLPRVEVSRFEPFLFGGANQIVLTAGFVFVAFGGLLKVASVAEEVRDPARTVPRALFGSVLAVTALYVLMLIVTVGVTDAGALAGATTPIANAAAAVAGPVGYLLLTLAAALAFLTTANAGILAASRYPMALARDELLPAQFARLGRRSGTPLISVGATGVFVALFLLLELTVLVKAASTFLIVNYVLSHISLILLRTSGVQNYRPGFRSPLFPWIQLFGIAASILLIVDLGWETVAITVGAIAVASLLYLAFGHRAASKGESALVRLLARVTNRQLTGRGLEQELRDALHDRDGVSLDDIDALFARALVMDIDGVSTSRELIREIAPRYAEQLGIEASQVERLLIEREEQSSTAISGFVAVPHLVSDQLQQLDIAVVRIRDGCAFADASSVRAVFVIAGPTSRRNLHLRVLSAVAQLVQEPEFENRWINATDTETLRDLLLLSRRVRHRPPDARRDRNKGTKDKDTQEVMNSA
jgi:amino acid transporter/mannitol/fructose-specific phosphotransferase system IIA component (Ntr-type)